MENSVENRVTEYNGGHSLADLLASELVPYKDAAATLGIEPKRLLGLMMRQRVDDPIGGQAEDGRIYVYGWSCKSLAERAAVTDSEVQP